MPLEAKEEAEKEDIDTRFEKLEAEFMLAVTNAKASLVEAKKLRSSAALLDAKANKLVEEAAEKYNVPITWGKGGYVPKNLKDWLPGDDEELSDMMHDLVYDYASGQKTPGWWQPSAYC